MNTLPKFDYPHDLIHVILRSSLKENVFFGVDKFESKRIRILLAKHGTRNEFHTLPGHLTANLYPFIRDRIRQTYRLDENRLVPVQLNTLEEVIVLKPVF